MTSGGERVFRLLGVDLEDMDPATRALALAISADVTRAEAFPFSSEDGGWGIVLRRRSGAPLLITPRVHGSQEEAVAALRDVLLGHAKMAVPTLQESVSYHIEKAEREKELAEKDRERLDAYRAAVALACQAD